VVFRILRGAVRPLLRWYFHLRVTGSDECPGGPLIVAANHASFLDPFILQVTFPRRIVFMVTASFYDLWRFRWFLWLMGCIRVEDEAPNRRALEQAFAVLERGGVIGIFPEGAISRDGKLQPAQPGAAAMVLRAHAPLVPAYIKGLFEAFPRTARFPRPKPVEVRYGRPISYDGIATDLPRRLRTRQLTRELMQELARLGQVTAPVSDLDPLPKR
jgi:1-acyl-sn-glycerol-3-phosphate acyltransferase